MLVFNALPLQTYSLQAPWEIKPTCEKGYLCLLRDTTVLHAVINVSRGGLGPTA